MQLRDLFQAQIAQRKQQVIWPKLFYLTPDGYNTGGLMMCSMPEADLDRCKLVPAANQQHMQLGSILPILYNPADFVGTRIGSGR